MNDIKSERLNLKFAKSEDRREIFDMLISPETIEFMFDNDHPAPTWEEFSSEDESYYAGEPRKTGSYLLIEIDGETIGSVSYACEYEKIAYCELDIWMNSIKHTGLGIGTETINLVVEFVNRSFGIRDFIIRPWAKNIHAIKAYKKCGFVERDDLSIKDYYSNEAYLENGTGDYGIDETLNLYKILD